MRPGKRVLLAADRVWYADSYRTLLTTWGFSVAQSAETAQAVLAVYPQPEDIARLHAQHTPAPIIFLVRSFQERFAAMQMGARFVSLDHAEVREQLRFALIERGRSRVQTAERQAA